MVFNSLQNLRRVTHFRLCLLETQVRGACWLHASLEKEQSLFFLLCKELCSLHTISVKPAKVMVVRRMVWWPPHGTDQPWPATSDCFLVIGYIDQGSLAYFKISKSFFFKLTNLTCFKLSKNQNKWSEF